jgi:FkbM family methyltransferase
MKSYKRRFRDWIERRLGISIFRSSGLPHGVSVTRDLRKLGITPKVVFDVGAHVGLKTIEYDNAWPDARVFSFEPIDSTFDRLKKNTKSKKVNIYNFGFGSRKKKTKISLHERSNLNSLAVNKERGYGSEEIRIKKIDNFCDEENIGKIDFLKIDTEGYGMNVIKGGKNMIENGKIESILVEVGFEENKSRHIEINNMRKFLEEKGMELCGLYNQAVNCKERKFRFADALFIRRL